MIADSAIDALSYAALDPDDRTRYASVGGEPSAKQVALVTAAIMRMKPVSEIVGAMDCDEGERHLSRIIGDASRHPACCDVTFRMHLPQREGDDWNGVLKDRSNSFPADRVQHLPGLKPTGF